MNVRYLICWVLVITFACLRFFRPTTNTEVADFPVGPIEIVVPFAAGGGSDVFSRIVENAINENQLLPQPVFITNIPGGSGTIGSRAVKNAKPNGYTILCLHEGIMTSFHSGTVPFGPEAFEAIAQTGNIAEVVVVKDDSRWEDLPGLLAEAVSKPDTLRFGTNIGAPAHFAGLILEKAHAGARFQYVQSGGGQKRYSLLVGGHIDLGVFSLSEYVTYRGDETTPLDQRLRALAVFSADRHPSAPEVPTTLEFGINAVSGNAQYWWAPKGTPDNRIKIIGDALQAAMEDPQTRERLASLRIDPIFKEGEQLQNFLEERTAELATVSVNPRTKLPDFAILTCYLVCALGFLILLESLWSRKRGASVAPASASGSLSSTLDSPRHRLTICIGSLFVYVAMLQFTELPFFLPTSFFVFVVGFSMNGCNFSKLQAMILLACLSAFTIEFLFSQMLSVVLP